MNDRKKSDLTAKAAFAVAKDAAERALDDVLASDEERAARKAEETAAAQSKRKKRIALGVVGLLLVLGVIGLVLHYWYWFLLAGLVGLAFVYARYRWGKRRPRNEPRALPPAQPETREERREVRVAVQPPDESVEDELAALKARVRK